MKCNLCSGVNLEIRDEEIIDNFGGECFEYIETFTICNGCGWIFCTEEQSTNNLIKRIEGKKDEY